MIAALLLQQQHQEKMSRFLQGVREGVEESSTATWIRSLEILAVCGILAGAFYLIRRTRAQWREREGHLDLFRRLAAAHSLERSEERTLLRLAQRAGLAQPAEVFIRRDLLREVLLVEARSAQEQNLISELTSRLFR